MVAAAGIYLGTSSTSKSTSSIVTTSSTSSSSTTSSSSSTSQTSSTTSSVASSSSSVASSSSSTTSSSSTSTVNQTAVDQALYATALSKGETTLVIYSSLTTSQFPALQAAFNALYPKISLQFTNQAPTTAITLISSQEQAQGYSADIAQFSYTTDYTLYQDKYIVPYVSPWISTFPASASSALDPLNMSTPTYALPTVFEYNTNLLKVPPTTLAQISSNLYKGQIIMLDPTTGTSATAYFGTLSNVLGNATVTSFLQALHTNVNPALTTSQTAVTSDVAAGQYSIGLVALLTDAIPDIQAGAPIGFINVPGVPVMIAYTNTAILTGTKAPDAAKLFIDFVTSPAGQLAIGNINTRFPINTNVQSTYNLATSLNQYAKGQTTYQDPDLHYFSVATEFQTEYTNIFG